MKMVYSGHKCYYEATLHGNSILLQQDVPKTDNTNHCNADNPTGGLDGMEEQDWEQQVSQGYFT